MIIIIAEEQGNIYFKTRAHQCINYMYNNNYNYNNRIWPNQHMIAHLLLHRLLYHLLVKDIIHMIYIYIIFIDA